MARTQRLFSRHRLLSCARRETLELLRNQIRLAMSLLGTVLLMLIMGYGISLDVQDLRYAVLDRDGSASSRAYTLELSGSPYFIEQAPLGGDAEMDRRMRSGELALAVEIPPGFGADLARGRPATVGVWIDGAMPMRAEIVSGYVQALHTGFVAQRLADAGVDIRPTASVEVRYRYNPGVRSIVSMVPAVIPILLIFIPSMLAALAVVREKEMGSITNLYVTPVTKLEFLFGKQLPYVGAGMVNFSSNPDGGHAVRRAVHRQPGHLHAGRAALRVRGHGAGAADVSLHQQPACGAVRHRAGHHAAGDPVLGHPEPGLHARGLLGGDGPDLPNRAFRHHQQGHVLQGAGLGGP